MGLRETIRWDMGKLYKDACVMFGRAVTWTNRSNTGITLLAMPGPESTQLRDELGLTREETARSFEVPVQAGILSRITTKALTTNVATITTREAHGFVAGQVVHVMLETADTVFDGLRLIASVPTSTTFTFARTNTNVASAEAFGWALCAPNEGDKITMDGLDYEVRRFGKDDLGALYTLECAQVLVRHAGAE